MQAAEIVTGVIGVGGTVVGGPVLRLARWSDWKTSFLDALNVSAGTALLVMAYLHLALRVDAVILPRMGQLGRGDRVAYSTLAFTVFAVIVGFSLLRRHRLLRSTLTAMLVMIAVAVCVFFYILYVKR